MIDAYVRVSLVGIELITIDARIVIASVDTYLRFAEAVSRLDISASGGKTLGEVQQGVYRGAARGATGAVIETAQDAFESVVERGKDALGLGDRDRE